MKGNWFKGGFGRVENPRDFKRTFENQEGKGFQKNFWPRGGLLYFTFYWIFLVSYKISHRGSRFLHSLTYLPLCASLSCFQKSILQFQFFFVSTVCHEFRKFIAPIYNFTKKAFCPKTKLF